MEVRAPVAVTSAVEVRFALDVITAVGTAVGIVVGAAATGVGVGWPGKTTVDNPVVDTTCPATNGVSPASMNSSNPVPPKVLIASSGLLIPGSCTIIRHAPER